MKHTKDLTLKNKTSVSLIDQFAAEKRRETGAPQRRHVQEEA
jgi:hypothetical protein